MPSAEIITIGTEILLGEIVDTNARYIARVLRSHGVDIFRTTTIGDNAERIAVAVRDALEHADIVITTGGLGPTVDDPTREAIALAVGVEAEFREDLWQQVIDRFARFDRYPTENNRRQAYIPAGATGIENPVGTAPCFLVEIGDKLIVSLPGVPREMEHILHHSVIPDLQQRFQMNEVLVVRVLHTSGAGESQIDEMISDLERLSNPTVGLAAHSGQVDIRVGAKAGSSDAALALIAPVETELRTRLDDYIYGADEDTLATAALQRFEALGWSLALVEAGLGGALLSGMPTGTDLFRGGLLHPHPPDDPQMLKEMARSVRTAMAADAALAVGLYPGEKSDIYVALATPVEEKFLRVGYGGPQKMAAQRAANLGLDVLRRL